MTYPIRPAQPTDAEALAQLLLDLGWSAHLGGKSVEEILPTVRQHLELCLADDSHSIYVAEAEGGGLAGYGSVHWLPYLFLPGPEGFVSELFVHEAARGLGVGSRLLETIKEEAIQRGCFRLSLLNNRNRESYHRSFYQKQGWEERTPMANFSLRLSP
jgi:GNAT superfamily N-acetyltransferase